MMTRMTRAVVAAAFVFLGAASAMADPQPDPECVGKSPGDVCRAATACSDATVCSDNLKCPNGPVNPQDYNGSPCDSDNNACTADVCAGGQCRHNEISCDDGSACTIDGCDQIEGCQHSIVDCDDGVACTTDSCSAAVGCQHAYVTNDCGSATCGTSACGNTCGPECTTACVPEITCPTPDTVECVNGQGQNTLGAATATCDAEITNDGEASYPFSCEGDNIHEVTYSAVNGDGSDSCISAVAVEDTGKPNVTCGANSTVRTSEQGGLCSVSLVTSASGTDACEGALEGTCDPAELTLSAPGTTSATCTVADCSGNTSDSCNQSLTLIDDTPPTITCATPYVTPPLAPMTWTAATVADNCGGTASAVVTSVDCYAINGAGKTVSKLAACKATYSGETIKVGPSAGGVNTIIKWTVSSSDGTGNRATATCMTQVQNPGLTKP